MDIHPEMVDLIGGADNSDRRKLLEIRNVFHMGELFFGLMMVQKQLLWCFVPSVAIHFSDNVRFCTELGIWKAVTRPMHEIDGLAIKYASK